MTAPDGVVIVLTPNQEIALNLHTYTQFGVFRGGARTLDHQVVGRRAPPMHFCGTQRAFF